MENLRGYIERLMREENQGVFSFFLLIISLFYGFLQRGRAFLYEKGLLKTVRIKARVISAGNITVGGTGKTPAVMAIAQAAKEKGFKVAILTRGYKGESKGINPVSDGSRVLLDCKDAGDEPYLMAKKLEGIPLVKGGDRYLSAKFAIEKFGSNLFILDDGFQHLRVHRDTNILLIDSLDPFGNGHLFPRGILREPLMAMKRANIIVITKADLSPRRMEIIEKIRKYNPAAPVFFSYYKPLDLINIKGDLIPIRDIKGERLFLFSGLASHQSFRLLLERDGAKIIKELTYPDHFFYSKGDIEEIKERAGALGADMIVTTEKDIVRIPDSGVKTQDSMLNQACPGDKARVQDKTQIWALRIEFVIEDKERWESLLFQKGTKIGGDN